MFLTVIFIAVGIRLPLILRETGKATEVEPVIIQIEDIPETRQTTQVSVPKLSMPLEIEDDIVMDDVTIENTDLDIISDAVPPPPPVVVQEEAIEEVFEEEVFEMFSVEEVPGKLEEIAAEYPQEALDKRIEGTVYIRALVGSDGFVKEVIVLKGPSSLHKAAIDAALKTPFRPATQNGQPVNCWVQLSYRFVIE